MTKIKCVPLFLNKMYNSCLQTEQGCQYWANFRPSVSAEKLGVLSVVHAPMPTDYYINAHMYFALTVNEFYRCMLLLVGCWIEWTQQVGLLLGGLSAGICMQIWQP